MTFNYFYLDHMAALEFIVRFSLQVPLHFEQLKRGIMYEKSSQDLENSLRKSVQSGRQGQDPRDGVLPAKTVLSERAKRGKNIQNGRKSKWPPCKVL